MSMQIGAGWAKGMRCEAPTGDATRPTGAKVRAAVFNMLQGVIEGARVLDLFAGSGAVGLEALSRGAASAVLVDKAAPAVAVIRKNAAELARRAEKQGLGSPVVRIETRGAEVALAGLVRAGAQFDLLFLDPPYKDAQKLAAELAEALGAVAAPGATLMLETAGGDEEAVAGIFTAPQWELTKQKVYGDTLVTVWERAGT